MKTTIIIRHGHRIGAHITPECLEEIRQNGIPGLPRNINRIHMGSAWQRTWETLEAYVQWRQNRGELFKPPFLEPDSRFGSPALWEEMGGWEKPFLELVNLGISEFQALRAIVPKKEFEKWSRNVYWALLNIFESIDQNEVCLSCGHTPLIEMLANVVLDWQLEDASLGPLEGFVFVQTRNKIKVTRLY